MWLKFNLHHHALIFNLFTALMQWVKSFLIHQLMSYDHSPKSDYSQSVTSITWIYLITYRPGMNLMPSWAHLQGRSFVWNPLVSCLDFKFNIKNKCKNQNQIQDSCSSLCVFRRRENNYKESFLHLMNLFASHVMKNPHVWLFLRRFARGGESYKNVPI